MPESSADFAAVPPDARDQLYAAALAAADYEAAEQQVAPELGLLQEDGDSHLLTVLLAAARVGLRGVRESMWPSWTPYLPGERTLRCDPGLCQANCCSATGMLVRITPPEIRRIETQEHIPAGHFVGRSRILFKEQCGRCVFLAPDDRCTVYESRPSACYQYPFKVGFFALDAGQLVPCMPRLYPPARLLAETARFCRKDPQAEVIPLLYRDHACPGLTGPPISLAAYLQLAQDLAVRNLGQEAAGRSS